MTRSREATEATILGRKLRDARERNGLSLRGLAHRAEVSPSFLSRVERGQRSVSAIALARLAAILDQDVGALLDHVLVVTPHPGAEDGDAWPALGPRGRD